MTATVEAIERALARIEADNPRLNCFTHVTRERALREARAVDAARAKGEPLGPLAGRPYAAKNLFDIEGLTTVAGSKIHRSHPPARRDAKLVERMSRAGAILVGATNMDEYAYGFVTENAHDGPTHNPHDLTRSAGGSSGGSAAAVAAGLVPYSLGSDTNGSIRVPASLCGIWGLKPTFGRLPRTGAFPFVASLDHVGPFATSAVDLAAVYDALQGPDAADPVCAQRAPEPASPALGKGLEGLKLATLGGYFDENANPEALAARDAVSKALGASRRVEIPEAARARAAAFVITAAEGASFHMESLRKRAADFDPATRDRFLAGACVPAGWVLRAQRFRLWYYRAVMRLFESADILIAPTVPDVAPTLGQATLEINGRSLPCRPSLGLLTQPISFIGLPVVAAPVHGDGLPLGVQLIAAPWREADLLRVAAWLEAQGVARAKAAP